MEKKSIQLMVSFSQCEMDREKRSTIPYRFTSACDNRLDALYEMAKAKYGDSGSESKDLVKCNMKYPFKTASSIGFMDMSGMSLIKSASDFVCQIRVPNKKALRPLNDTSHPPSRRVYDALLGKTTIPQSSIDDAPKLSIDDDMTSAVHEEWTWECYSKNQIWRAIPTSTHAFIASPIYRLIAYLHAMFRVWMPTLRFHYCVLQRVPPGGGIGCHTDGDGKRRASFVLYLTTLQNSDGGELCIIDPESEIKMWNIRPQVGRMITWPLSETDPGPLHAVKPLSPTCFTPRIALVGFLY